MRRRLLLLTLAALVAAGCHGEDSAAPPPTRVPSFTDPPLPSGAVAAQPHTSPPPEQVTCSDPTASLRPDGRGGPAVDAIRARGRLLVGLDPGSNLFSFRDPATGTLSGFDVGIAREIARDLLGDPEKIEYRILGSADREQALAEHTVDVVVKTMTITCERRQRVSFSTSYLQAHQRVLTVRDTGIGGLADLAGRRVCVVGGTTSLDRIRRQQPAASLLTVPSWADCLVVLQQRQVDAISTDDTILAGLAVQDPLTVVTGEDLSTEQYGIGIPKDRDDLVRFVNGTLERIRGDGTWDRLYQRWLAPQLGTAAIPPPPRYRD
ncbi:glutamate ABC transporter substrate-binding protein [Nocardia otitidiscaviarum]|uniref:PEB1 n=1 Tax=Nocardia otitidiscaviarum TaxID=1823 RepID=A0A378YC43_9NOCA|nr:glutamate ABC transporter substrate-binding protein [Nocardia otitidiscaviarum]MBF6137921.1 glutamate ABC transporter substrate-binding protein [Nocardia otitidiscaviarum]MBF6241614.1 glutamate ABC transporter substrate-binding protein [Nocardia otitidiscaviarum]MBF6488920.1 glutamate ABC transporter substrate-binding protein [Nocardia otitidiscaviarum]SUA73947.1 PEB1 [Nocardia otitidiscaviarum]